MHLIWTYPHHEYNFRTVSNALSGKKPFVCLTFCFSNMEKKNGRLLQTDKLNKVQNWATKLN